MSSNKTASDLDSLVLKNIVSNMLGHVYWKDQDGVYLGCNDRQAKSLGLQFGSEVVGRTDFDLPWPSNFAQEFRENDLRIMTTGVAEIIEENASVNGVVTSVLSIKAPLKSETGDTYGILGISIDITKQKQAQEEAAIAKVKAKAEVELRQAVMILSGSIAHDLRTPISTIEMGSQTLQEYLPYLVEGCARAEKAGLIERPNRGVSAEKLQEVFVRNIRYTEKMQNYITDSLSSLKQLVLGKIEQKNLVSCEIWACLSGFTSHYPYENREDRQKIHCDYSYGFTFMGHKGLFERILSNLVKNAFYQIKKNGHGEIFLKTDDGGDMNLLRVKDTAGNASADVINTLFQGFKTTKVQGTGVGLGFCKLTMESFGGDISCHSVDGDCIEFVLSFPKVA
jgi:PAS domain S-box-containing protein